MRKFFLALIFTAAAPLNVSAALAHFPVTQSEIEQHVIQNTDIISVGVHVLGDGNPFGGHWWDFDSYAKKDGTSESIHALALRDPQGFKDLVVRMLHAAVDTLDKSDMSQVGKTLRVSYLLEKDSRLPVVFPEFDLLYGGHEVLLSVGPDGKVAVPSEAFQAAFGYPDGAAFYVPGILEAEVILRDEAGEATGTITSREDSYRGVRIKPARDELILWLYPQLQRRGTLHLVYRGGTEQTFDLNTGDLTGTILPDLRPAAVVSEGGGLYLLVKGPEDGREVVVDTASDLPAGVFPRWEKLPLAELVKANKATVSGPGVLAIPLTVQGRGFFQARAVPSLKKVLPPKVR